MATHSSVLAWRIPGTVEPGGLPSMGSHSRTRLKRLSSSRRINTFAGGLHSLKSHIWMVSLDSIFEEDWCVLQNAIRSF